MEAKIERANFRLIVARIEAEQELVNVNKELIKLYEQKIKDKIEEAWRK